MNINAENNFSTNLEDTLPLQKEINNLQKMIDENSNVDSNCSFSTDPRNTQDFNIVNSLDKL